jgi:hypothetical protein
MHLERKIKEEAQSALGGAGAVLLPYNADAAITAGAGGNIDLSVTVIRITPAPAFEEAVRSGDLTHDDATGQLAALINHAASELTHI